MALGTYRTCTYIAGDWDNDKDAIDQLKRWNESNHWGLRFKDVHELTSSRDTSRACSIKNSLRERMSVSKTFVLVVGDSTKYLRKGSCEYCPEKRWSSLYGINYCSKGYSYDTKSFVDYEIDQAIKAYNEGKMDIIVLYKAATVNKEKCPSAIWNYGYHTGMKSTQYYPYTHIDWDYGKVKAAFDSL